MAAEGYVFAKLPKCHLMPQLQDWIMYRKGVAFSETDKSTLLSHIYTKYKYYFSFDIFSILYINAFDLYTNAIFAFDLYVPIFSLTENLMQTTVVTWMHIEKLHKLPIKKPSLHMSKHQMDRLTYDRAEETKRKVN